MVGEAVDCEARDANTGLVTLLGDHVTQVPILMEPDFKGEKIEIRVIDPQTRTVWAQKELINEILD